MREHIKDNLRPVFKPGDRVSFCGEEATVVSNWGISGTVKDNTGTQMHWYWEFQGEPVVLVRP